MLRASLHTAGLAAVFSVAWFSRREGPQYDVTHEKTRLRLQAMAHTGLVYVSFWWLPSLTSPLFSNRISDSPSSSSSLTPAALHVLYGDCVKTLLSKYPHGSHCIVSTAAALGWRSSAILAARAQLRYHALSSHCAFSPFPQGRRRTWTAGNHVATRCLHRVCPSQGPSCPTAGDHDGPPLPPRRSPLPTELLSLMEQLFWNSVGDAAVGALTEC